MSHHADWASVEPLTYLEPFLDVIRSPETSGPITGVALTSVKRLLDNYSFGEAPHYGQAQILQCHTFPPLEDLAQ